MDNLEALTAEFFNKVDAFLSENALEFYEPYPFQKAHHTDVRERMVMAANRVGKTQCAAAEVAMHATGEYPDWWEGKRFDKPGLIWVGSVTSESSRDITQRALIGGIGEELGTGFIPKSKIKGKPKMRQAGVSDVVDTVKVKHRRGTSTIVFKTYDQGWQKWQGTAPIVVWLDEEPDDYKIYTEALTRILTSKGTIMVTFTPLLGVTDLVLHFQEGLRGTQLVTATWDDAPHLDEDDKNELKQSYPDYEVEARTLGVPMMGQGRVFPFSEEDIKVSVMPIPPHFAKIKGIDFGYGHPFGLCDLAIDRDKDIIYVTRSYRETGGDAATHAEAINRVDSWAPVSWPHDGHQHDKGSGKELRHQYVEKGVKMLSRSARYDNKTGGRQAVEPVVQDVINMMQQGQFKVFESCKEFFEEFRSYHRDDSGKIVAKRDDVLKACFYAVMMRRYAKTKPHHRKIEVMPSVGMHL